MKRFVAREATRLSAALSAMDEPLESLVEGRVFVGGERASVDRDLGQGEIVLVWAARSEGHGAPTADGSRVRRLFESRDLLVVEKPADLPTEPDHRGLRSLLHEASADLRLPVSTLHAHTRLDVGVSGVVLISKTKSGHAHVSSLTRERALEKRYVAIVSGHARDEGSVDAPLGKAGRSREATTGFVTLGRTRAGSSSFSLLLVTPETGRWHQIRIHLASLGTPILGDRKHGGSRALVHASGRVTSLDRILLHAYSLTLPGEPALEAAVPTIFTETWRDLDGSPEAWKNLLVA